MQETKHKISRVVQYDILNAHHYVFFNNQAGNKSKDRGHKGSENAQHNGAFAHSEVQR